MTDKQIIFDDVDVKDCIAYAKSQTVYLGNTAYKQMEKVCMVKNQPCKFFDCQFKQMARELKAKEQECEELREALNGCCLHNLTLMTEKRVLLQTIADIKEVLQFYNNTTIGVDKGNGIFEFEVSNDNIGKLIYCYDTNPAKRALQKISEVEDEV